MDSNAVFAILLLLAGLGILISEVFLPSGGLLGVITFLTLVVSLVFAYRAWGTAHPNIFWAFCGALLVLVPTAFGTAVYILPKTPMGKRVLLEAPSIEDVTPFAAHSRHLHELVGKFGRTASPLNPGGLVNIGGERLHAISEGLSVDSGQSVEVIDVRSGRLVVRPGQPAPASPSNENPQEISRFDFEIPQG